MDSKKLLEAMRDIQAKYGEGTIYVLGSKKERMNIPKWDTGLFDLNEIIGGGIPEGRIIELYGTEGSGKTTLAHHLTAQCEKAINIPIEGTFSSERARIFGNKPKQLIVRRAEFGEEVMESTIEFARAGVPLIVIDSVPAIDRKSVV